MPDFLKLLCLFIWLVQTTSTLHKNRQLQTKPNIILILTDDQDVELGSMAVMPKTLRALRDKGIEFKYGLVSTPICCPSRTSILTGLYVHNHHVTTNNNNCSGVDWRNIYEKTTFATVLKEGGYLTSYFGKYLNEYEGSYVPPGYDYWMGLVGNSRYYNYTLNFNGEKVKHGFDYGKDYFTDNIANETIKFINNHIHSNSPKPFLSVLSFPSPHGPEDPAPQYSTLFPDNDSHRTASWNYAPNPDKQWLLQRTGKMEPVHVVFTNMLAKRRLQTLQSVDDAVQNLINNLRDLNILQNTYIIYSSDHGYHLGQFGLLKGKNMPFEFDIKVPFFIRGPGLEKNISINEIVSNIDIAPTIIDMAGLKIPKNMDGRSIMELVKLKQMNVSTTNKWRQTLLIERGKMAKLYKIKTRFLQQKDTFTKALVLDVQCVKPEYSYPCKNGQKWNCQKDAESKRWKVLKCRKQIEIGDGNCQCDNKGRRVKRLSPKIDDLLNNWEDEFIWDNKSDGANNDWYQGMMKEKRNVKGKEMITEIARDVLCLNVDHSYCESEYGKKIHKLKRKLNKVREDRRRLRNQRKCQCLKENRHPLVSHTLHFSNITSIPKSFKTFQKKGNNHECNVPQMNCFTHDSTHWKTEPKWPVDYGQFCFCQNTNNNTYWCLRTKNETSNFLYCEFITGFISYYDISIDPNQVSIQKLNLHLISLL
uniref:Sulfatase domain-containing protein n=1 Tax=Rhabditophanes sp. KR3021 TaxID=114890 RepID=A0AC35UES2_9BILA